MTEQRDYYLALQLSALAHADIILTLHAFYCQNAAFRHRPDLQDTCQIYKIMMFRTVTVVTACQSKDLAHFWSSCLYVEKTDLAFSSFFFVFDNHDFQAVLITASNNWWRSALLEKSLELPALNQSMLSLALFMPHQLAWVAVTQIITYATAHMGGRLGRFLLGMRKLPPRHATVQTCPWNHWTLTASFFRFVMLN